MIQPQMLIVLRLRSTEMREAEVAGDYYRGGWCQLGLEGDESQAATGEGSLPGGDDSTEDH